MKDWTYKDGKYTHYLNTNDPNYGSFLYAFLMDSKLKDPEVNSINEDESLTIFSNSKWIQKDSGAIPVPSHRKFLEMISPIHVGIADVGDGRRVGIALDAPESFRQKKYIMQMFFYDYLDANGTPCMFSKEEREEIIERIHENAKAYSKLSFGSKKAF